MVPGETPLGVPGGVRPKRSGLRALCPPYAVEMRLNRGVLAAPLPFEWELGAGPLAVICIANGKLAISKCPNRGNDSETSNDNRHDKCQRYFSLVLGYDSGAKESAEKGLEPRRACSESWLASPKVATY